MILTVDIGNTSISIGVLRGRRVVDSYAVDRRCPGKRLRVELKKVLRGINKTAPGIGRAVICSVVPSALRTVEQEVLRHFKIETWVVGRDVHVPMTNHYRRPREVGQDRLVCAYAAQCLYGYPAIVIDFGTATTFDVISAKGAYEGGMIVPGIRLSAETLFQKTALLPRVDVLKVPRSLVGKTTEESILSGLFNGYGVMCAGLIDRLCRYLGGSPHVIVTGGHAALMKKFISPRVTRVDKDLIFKGMALLASGM